MAWTPQARLLRSDTRVRANSTANTDVFLANHRGGIFRRFARQALRRWSRSTMDKKNVAVSHQLDAEHPNLRMARQPGTISGRLERTSSVHLSAARALTSNHRGVAIE